MRDFKLLSKKELKENSATAFFDDDQKNKAIRGGSRGGGMRGGRPMGFEKPKNIRKTVFRLIGYLGVYKYWIIVVALLTMGATFFNLMIPFLFADAIDTYIIPGRYDEILQIALFILAIALGNSFIRFLSRYVMAVISQRVIKKIRQDAFDSLLKAPLSYYDEKGSGDTVSRISNDVELINASLAQSVLEVINSSIVLVGSVIYMFILNWVLSIIVLLFIPFMIKFTIFISKRTRTGFKDQQIYLASLNGIIEENITGLKAVKLYGQERAFSEEFKHENDKLREAGFKAQVYAGILWPFIHFMNNLIYLVVISVGAIMYLFSPLAITIGQISGVSQYSRMFIMPISNLSQLFNALMAGVAGAERVFELIDTPSEYENDGVEAFDHFKGSIEFDNVSFGYNEETLVLKNISFKAKQGEIIAIVGPTGGGKTTTINLINRFYNIQNGVIKIDGIPINDLKMDALRKRIGVVLQDTKLFKGTVFENIQYGDFSKTKEEVIEAAKQANAHDFISKLPKGYDTLVFEGGQNFSQGERQLVSIARTILSNPSLLILDEATSNIDTRTEAKIQKSMETLMKGRTSIVIAHRLQTIEKASKIIVINQGELVEEGTHKSLLEARGFYHHLYQAQFEA
jgi:ATP-binding cassette, subfamily B, multidrug efflux pump